MKKLFGLFVLMLTFAVAYPQTVGYQVTDSIAITDITGTDTTLFIPFRSEFGSSITFDFTNFDAWDAILSFGYSTDKVGITTIDDNRNPFTLDSAVYAQAINGTTKCRIAFESDKWGFKYIAFKLTKTTVSSGTLIWTWNR